METTYVDQKESYHIVSCALKSLERMGSASREDQQRHIWVSFFEFTAVQIAIIENITGKEPDVSFDYEILGSLCYYGVKGWGKLNNSGVKVRGKPGYAVHCRHRPPVEQVFLDKHAHGLEQLQ